MWLENFTREHINEDIIEQLGETTLSQFEIWRKENNVKYETDSKKLGVELLNISTNGGVSKGRHTKKGKTKYFNIPILKKYFNLGLLIEFEDNDILENKFIDENDNINYDDNECELVEV